MGHPYNRNKLQTKIHLKHITNQLTNYKQEIKLEPKFISFPNSISKFAHPSNQQRADDLEEGIRIIGNAVINLTIATKLNCITITLHLI